MPQRSIRALTASVGFALLSLPAPSFALSSEQEQAYTRWKTALADFEAQAQSPAAPVLFVGSSTIRMWPHLSQDFRSVPAIVNRGFGGSTMHDCHLLVRELVIRYQPSAVLVYAGDNDLAQGRTPAQVLLSFQSFVQAVRQELPQTQVSFISIKPSPSRAALMPLARETNALVANFIAQLPNAKYIDVFTPMLGEDGQPRAQLYLADQLHMNAAGYALWQGVIAGHLPQTTQTALPATGIIPQTTP